MNLFDDDKQRRASDSDIERLMQHDVEAGEERPHGRHLARKKRRPLRTLVCIVAILAILAVGAVTAYSVWERPPEQITTLAVLPTAQPTPEQTPAPIATETPKPADPEPEETPEPTPTPEPTEPPEVLLDRISSALETERNNGIYTFLLVGLDKASNSTDTILVGMIDTNTHAINVVSIPRDTLVNVTWGNTPKKINTIYPGYINSGLSGTDGLLMHITKLLGFQVDCYAIVNLEVVEQVINEIGGIYFNVPIDMDYDDPDQYLHIHLKKGFQKLNGYETLGVFRYRSGYPGGDLDRIGVQQELMRAIAGQTVSIGNIPNLPAVLNIITEGVETNLSASNIAYFARQALKCNMEDISFETMPFDYLYDINLVSYVHINIDNWINLVNEKLNPFNVPISRYNVDIISYNGSYFDTTTGWIMGGYNSFYCAWCGGSHEANKCPYR